MNEGVGWSRCRLTGGAPDGTGPLSRAPLARGAIVDARVPQVSGKALDRRGG